MIKEDSVPSEESYYQNESTFKTGSHGKLEKLLSKQRNLYQETLKLLVKIISSLKGIKVAGTKLPKYKLELVELDREKIEMEAQVHDLKLGEHASVDFGSANQNSTKKYVDLQSVKRHINVNDWVDWGPHGIINFALIKDQIDYEQRKLAEELKKNNGSMSKFTKRRQAKLNLVVTTSQTLQQKFRNYIQSKIYENKQMYISVLNDLKSVQSDKPRKIRSKINIWILDEMKTCRDYDRNDMLVGNPRNPFKKLPNIDYDYEDSDYENELNEEADDEHSEIEENEPRNDFLKLFKNSDVNIDTKKSEITKVRLLYVIPKIQFDKVPDNSKIDAKTSKENQKKAMIEAYENEMMNESEETLADYLSSDKPKDRCVFTRNFDPLIQNFEGRPKCQIVEGPKHSSKRPSSVFRADVIGFAEVVDEIDVRGVQTKSKHEMSFQYHF
jgi:hypothetical protein